MRFRGSDSETLPEGLEEALRRTFVEAPSPATEARHLAMIEAADAEAAAARREPVPPARSSAARQWTRPALIRGAATLAAAVVALPVVFGGLALAGVSLPEPIDSAFESVGIDLPNQHPDGDDGDGDSAREDGRGSAGTSGGDAASSRAQGSKGEAPRDGDRKVSGNPESSASGVAGSASNGRPAHAQDGQTGAPAHSQQGGQGAGTPPSHAQDGVGGPPSHAEDGVGGPPSHAEDGEGDPPSHAQDGVGGSPPHAQGGASALPKPPKAEVPLPTPEK